MVVITIFGKQAWLSYHISISLAFQKFFQERKGVAVPNILVFDQPSQVYFPQKRIQEGSTTEEDSVLIQDEDKAAVKKIFATLSKYIEKAKSELQIIVMEHADEDIWGEFDNIKLVERWRGRNKLIPVDWISKQNYTLQVIESICLVVDLREIS